MVAFAADVAAFAAVHEVDIDVAGTMDVVEDLNLVFVARAFQPAGDSFDDRFRFVGAMIGEREQVQSWSSPHPELPLLFVSLGSIFTDRPDFYRTCVEAFGDGHFQVAMTIAMSIPPTSVRCHRRCRSHRGPAARCPAASPRLRHPCGDELDDGSALLRRPHACASSDARTGGQRRPRGRARPRAELDPQTITAEALRSAVDQVTVSPVIQANLHRMQAEVHDAGGAEAGAQAIEEYLA